MPDDDTYNPQEPFIVRPNTGKDKTLDGLYEAHTAAQILKLIKALPPKTPGVAEIKAGALILARAAGGRLSKSK